MKCMDYEFPNIKYTYKNSVNINYKGHLIANEMASHYVTGSSSRKNIRIIIIKTQLKQMKIQGF
jgi:hypothetical protein